MGVVANPMHITGIVSAQAARVDDAGLLAPQGSGLAVRTGVAWGPGTQTLVTGNGDTAPMSVWVGTHNWFTSRGTANGPYRGAAESTRTVTLAAAPASGSRIDVVYVKALDNTAGVPSPDGTAGESYAAVTGTPTTGTPVKPALPVGAEELATVTISAGATSTNGAGVVIANTSRLTVARGARIPVRSQADRDALTAFKGLEVYRLDTGQVQLYSGSAWVTVYDPAAAADTTGQVLLTKDQTGTGVTATNTTPVAISGIDGSTLTLASARKLTIILNAQTCKGTSGGELGRITVGAGGYSRRAQYYAAQDDTAGEVSVNVVISGTFAAGTVTIGATLLRVIGGTQVTVINSELTVIDGGPG